MTKEDDKPGISRHQAPDARLQARGLTCSYGGDEVFRSLDLAVPNGGVTVLLGPNGCGKSTLLRTLARLLTPVTGTVLLDGADLHRQPTKTVARTLGILVQGPTPPEGLRVYDLVRQGRYPHRAPLRPWSGRDEAAVRNAMDVTGVAAFADRPLTSLSGGQRQRCWIAMALAQEPDILLLDEPTTYLDVAHQLDILALLRNLNRLTGRTMVLVLHDLNHAAWHADHIVLMADGRIRAQGDPVSVLTPTNIRQVFGVEASILTVPENGRLVCVPFRRHDGATGQVLGK